ncbi:MAG: T9SS type A sorting domain-containing protein [bacterium]|nr:MAG: T9SS type A sorting domain-containing protein [bacterium]
MSVKSRIKVFFFLVALFLLAPAGYGQNNFPWPVEPLFQNHYITGAFCEYRSTSTSGHFHNGIDIPKADGSPVYAVKDGIITTIYPTTSNAYVAVEDKTYLHIQPNPALSVGDSVYATQTIVGTILPGLGHVHFNNWSGGHEVNSMLYNNSFSPIEDFWAPIIRYVSFYQNNTTIEFPTNELSGLVDIIVKVDEQSAPPGTSSSYLNNGTYKIGYKILSADSSTVVYAPPNGGLRFQFDSKPNNTYVNTVYFRPLSSTSSHVYQVTNNVTSDNYWDTRSLPQDDYVVFIFTEDTRQNGDTAYIPVSVVASDTTPPLQPAFKYVKGTDTGMQLGWYPNTDPDLKGYRLYFSFDNVNWSLFKDESVLTAAITDTVFNTVLNNAIYFRLTAVDDAPLPNESYPSDYYGMSNGSVFFDRVLIVDGYDRTDGGWPYPFHHFAYIFGNAIKGNQFSFDTVPNEAVEQNLINLNDYEAVFWILGDESVQNETFSSVEQDKIRAYLENGGYLCVSGSDIARDLDPNGNPAATPQDETFLRDYLKINFEYRTQVAYNLSGLSGSIWNGMSFLYGTSPYLLDSVDVISPWGSLVIPAMEYGTNQLAGIQYTGSFGSGSLGGKLVTCTFPFETISDQQAQQNFMNKILTFFFPTTHVFGDESPSMVKEYALSPNYPNPFNPVTTFSYQLPYPSRVELVIFNTLGQRVRTLYSEQQEPGSHQLHWDGRNDAGDLLASGIYIAVFSAKATHSGEIYSRTQKVLLTK